MKLHYDYFQYKLPDKSADYYIDKATITLKKLRELFPEQFKKNFRCSSEILTISGVRPFDTYYEFGEDTSDKQVADMKAFFKEKDIIVLEEDFPFAGEFNKERRYSLVNYPVLNDIPSRYGNLPGWRPFEAKNMSRDTDFFLWWVLWKQNAALALEDNKSPFTYGKNNMISFWTAENVTYGMLLGYPGEAICSLILEESDKLTSEAVEADIKHAQDYNGAWPVYSFAKEVADNPNIVAHQKLWSDILTGVYKGL